MTANERFKKRARKYAAEHGVAPAAAARILREKAAQRQAPADQPPSHADIHHGGGHTTSMPADLGVVVGVTGQETGPADAEQQAVVVDLSSLARGSDGKTETAVDLAAMFSNGGAPRVIDVAPLSGVRQTGLVKGGRGKSDAVELLAEAMKEIRRFEPVLIDIDSHAPSAPPQRPPARQRVAAFLISWLVRVAGSEDPDQVTEWLRERGHPLTPPKRLILRMLLSEPALRTKQPSSSLAGDDPDEYMGDVIGLIGEELDAVVAAQSRYLRSYLDLEQPEPKLSDLQVPPPSPLPGGLMQWPSLGAKGGRCAGLPACRVRCTCEGPSGPSTGGAAHLARSFGQPPLGVDELLKRKGRGSGPKRTGHDGRRRQH